MSEDKKEKKGFWQNWMTIAILVALILTVFLFNSQSSSIRTKQNSIGNGTGSNISIMNNDTYFKSYVKVNIGSILENLDCISKAGKIRNFNATESCGKFLSESSNSSLRHISEYNVSPSLQMALDEYKNALEYYNIGGAKLEIGARNRNLTQMGEAIGYIQNGTVYINRVTGVLYGNGS